MTTTFAMATPTHEGEILLAITIANTQEDIVSGEATRPGSTHGRRCFRATTAMAAGEAILAP